MIKNNSPWIKELNFDRITNKLKGSHSTDVAIIGGGIAGMTTAYFTLKNTDKKVVLIEAGKIAHGATGHNAGQVVDYFERPFSDLVAEFGLKMASEAQNSIHSAWDLLNIILIDSGIDINFSKFIGYAGCASLQHLNLHLHNKYLKKKGGVSIHKVLVSEDFKQLGEISKKYRELYDIVSHSHIQDLLETQNTHYIAALQSHKGCLNSALFVEKLAEFLLEKYQNRFSLIEHSPIATLELFKNHAILNSPEGRATANHVVLCTNGFEKIQIVNRVGNGEDINKSYHSRIYGIVGYMAGYVEKRKKDPVAISYFPHHKDIGNGDPYFYLTRRNFRSEDDENLSLICIGGPEKVHETEFSYYKNRRYPKKAKEQINKFLKHSYKHSPEDTDKFNYTWHGLMGYTPNSIRCIGPDPMNQVLLYNLGCNGIGILPSIYGGKKISDHIGHKPVSRTIFDPIRN